MGDSVSSPSSDESQPEIVPHASALQVRWTHPTFTTLGYLAMLWGFCARHSLGHRRVRGQSFWRGDKGRTGNLAASRRCSRCGVDAALSLVPCHVRFLRSEPVSPVSAGRDCVQRSKTLFPSGKRPILASIALQFRSYVELSALFGFLCVWFVFILFGAFGVLSHADAVTMMGVPVPFHGAARLLWFMLATPLFYAVYSALLGVVAFIPFRLLTRMFARAVLPSAEVAACETRSATKAAIVLLLALSGFLGLQLAWYYWQNRRSRRKPAWPSSSEPIEVNWINWPSTLTIMTATPMSRSTPRRTRRLFGDAAIVEAAVYCSSNSPPRGFVVKSDRSSKVGTECSYFRTPSLGYPAVNLYRGGDRLFAEYSACLLDRQGVERSYTIVFDLSKRD